ncbi:RNA recognition motif domain-containing protein [Limnofasciculus baicalensis]|uniref:RNA-binding protein n=1 Tax=Limnofasciculus baicalensis BBK-W-15 TaxID=2699891 RepID=A0AAE3GZZ2_9CYAN|nr:RNA-binding protein [Limnofasciculus baicalensis]MCP2731722.1 RNA-binding protein [Limnofasciculus baicalensis BBK-W-15]
MSVRLYVGNLPKDQVNRDELHAIFADANKSISTKVIKDRKTGKCRGFGFVTVPTDELADEIIEKFNGHIFQDAALKIEKAQPKSKGEDDESRPESSSGSTTSATATPTAAPRRGGGKKPKQRGGSSGSTTSTPDSGAIQPDPRWANQLAILKERLSAQASNP